MNKIKMLIEHYKKLGFREEHTFPGEYVLLLDLRFNKIRIYENGNVWKTNPYTGGYEKTTAQLELPTLQENL